VNRSCRIRSLLFVVLALVAPALAVALPVGPASAPDSMGFDWSRVPEYRIVPGDVLALNFGPRPDLVADILREATVRPDGRITVFPVGDVVAAGRTPRELQEALVSLLAPELKQPRVVVEVAKMESNKVHVLGQVNSPGSYPVEPFMTVVQAITAAGGFRDDAARNSVVLFSRLDGRTVRVARVRVKDILKRGTLAGDLPLSRFDIVYVPRNSVANMNVFTKQFFEGISLAIGTAFTGWELFNLDRVFVVPTAR
jgi:protein involved in polysaccharide export with SLBB domain